MSKIISLEIAGPGGHDPRKRDVDLHIRSLEAIKLRGNLSLTEELSIEESLAIWRYVRRYCFG